MDRRERAQAYKNKLNERTPTEKVLKKRNDLHDLNMKLSDAQRQSDEEMASHWKEEIKKRQAED